MVLYCYVSPRANIEKKFFNKRQAFFQTFTSFLVKKVLFSESGSVFLTFISSVWVPNLQINEKFQVALIVRTW